MAKAQALPKTADMENPSRLSHEKACLIRQLHDRLIEDTIAKSWQWSIKNVTVFGMSGR